jgi:hypothetical protein
MSNDVRRQERRLQRVFHRALLLALATPVAAAAAAVPAACGSTTQSSGVGHGGSGGAGVTGSGGVLSTAASSGSSSARAGSGGGTTTTTTTASSGSSTGTGGESPDAGSGEDADAAAEGGASCAPYAFAPSPPDTCGNYVRLPCGVPDGVAPAANCYLFLSDCTKFCTGYFFNCHGVDESCNDAGLLVPDSRGGVDIDCASCANGVGRVPAGLARARVTPAASPLGTYFAVAAHFEEASVHAFRRLRGELRAHRAPARLLRAARDAQRDEVRHARLTARMARRFGGRPAPVRVSPVAPRPLTAVAVENAVEGCVRETFGALVASFQAANAGDPDIARLMASIARDETRHAALSWSVARWAARALDPEARADLAARCQGAVEALRGEGGALVDGELCARAGLPTAAQREVLLGALQAHLWPRLDAALGERD